MPMTDSTKKRWYQALHVAQAAVTQDEGRLFVVVVRALLSFVNDSTQADFADYLEQRGIVDAIAAKRLRNIVSRWEGVESHPCSLAIEEGSNPLEHRINMESVSAAPAPSASEEPNSVQPILSSWTERQRNTENKYQDVRILGKGGMAEIYEARDRHLGRMVALKKIRDGHPDNEVLQRFVQEAQITAQLSHPNIVPIYDVGTLANGEPYFTMKRITGESLADILERLAVNDAETESQYDRTKLSIVFLQVVQAVAFAHARCVIHGDLKPSNILIGAFGDVLVADWGLASLKPDSMPSDGTAPVMLSPPQSIDFRSRISGSPAYMAPECVAGAAPNEQSDIFALGVILYEILTQQQPFGVFQFSDIVSQVQFHNVVPPRERTPQRGISEEVNAICLRALHPNPQERYANVVELRDAMESYITGSRRRSLALVYHSEAETARERWLELRKHSEGITTEWHDLAARIKPYDDEIKKHPLWKLEEEMLETNVAEERALTEALIGYSQAFGSDPDFAAASDRLADLHLGLFLDAEARQDRRAEIFNLQQVERFHRGRYRDILTGHGRVRIAPQQADVQICRAVRLVERHKKIETGEEVPVAGLHELDLDLAKGSYLFILHAPGRREVRLHVLVGRSTEAILTPYLYLEEEVGAEFVHVPAGPFVRGGDDQALNSHPRSEMILPDFFIARFPVTCAEYVIFLNDLLQKDAHLALQHTPRTKPDGGYLWEKVGGQYVLPRCDADGNPVHPQAPVMGISFHDAETYANWRSRKELLRYRLPSEDEWEKAARGADGRFFPWGNGFDPTFCKMALSRPGRPQPEPVGSFPVDTSVYGMQDASGAIREWCDSFYDDHHETRVLRGGAWYFNPRYCRAAFRHGYLPNIVFTNFGFRLCKSPPTTR